MTKSERVVTLVGWAVGIPMAPAVWVAYKIFRKVK